MIYGTQQKPLLQGYHQPYKRKNRATLVSCTILLAIWYVFTYRNHLTSSNIIHYEYQSFIILWYKYELF